MAISQPYLPPKSVLGNPYMISAPGQAISFAQLGGALLGNLVKQTLPTIVDFDYLPPQTLVGNPTATAGAALTFITFAQFNTLLTQLGLPLTVYKSFDPTSVPPYTVLGNLSSSVQLAVPVAIGAVAQAFGTKSAALGIFYFQNIFFYTAR